MSVARGTSRGTEKRCSGCGGDRDRLGQAYCKKCHRAYMQRWRENHDESITALKSQIKELRSQLEARAS